VEFAKVAMQPGGPQGAGTVDGVPVVTLPGNPVSSFVSFEVFVRPALLRMMGRRTLTRPQVTARLTDDVRGPTGKLQFARVEVRRDDRGWSATPTGARGSNLISTVARANGLAMIPVGTGAAPAGSTVQVLLFRSSED
jgi:molybdopterin molybdotransferase